MMDRQALFEKFLDVIQAEPTLPEYLGEEPEAVSSFDPYQMVAEWIALRHEVKQQGKLLQTSQNALQQALEAAQAEKAQLQQQLLDGQNQGLAQPHQKALWRDLIGVVDALDQACAHWQAQIEALDQSQPQAKASSQPFWQTWLQQFVSAQPNHPSHQVSDPSSLQEVLTSNQQGVDLIRRSLLDILRQQQVTPIAAQGQPFDAKTMYAIGRQASTAPENTVVQEVVRGYWWKDQILREAQVIVAGGED